MRTSSTATCSRLSNPELPTFEPNPVSAVRLDRGILPGMVEQGSGMVLHMSSIARRLPLFDATPSLVAAKAALTSYSKRFSEEGAAPFIPNNNPRNSISPTHE